jgi:dihydrofolate reductase
MRVSLVVAMTPERVIGKGGTLPWRLPADMRHFRRLTMGHPVLMGRRTYESIGAPLQGRINIVLSRDEGLSIPGGVVARTPEQALTLARAAVASPGSEGTGEIMVIGGAAIYAAFLSQATRLYITLVDAHLEGDTYFPSLEPADWLEVERSEHAADERNPYACTFLILERRPPGASRPGT